MPDVVEKQKVFLSTKLHLSYISPLKKRQAVGVISQG